MIRWLVQSVHDHPDLARGEPPPGLLSAAESAHLARLSVPKRRQDWLLGRWTAKHLLAAYLDGQGHATPLRAITIANDPTGAPYAYFDRPEPHRRIPVSLTISHSGGISFCALIAQGSNPSGPLGLPSVGCDVERVEPRSPSLARDFFTAQEQAALLDAPSHLHDALATAIWSAKEAALKALRLGLSVDTHLVSVMVEGDAFLHNEPLTGNDPAAMAEVPWPAHPTRRFDSSSPYAPSGWTPVSISLTGAAAGAATGLAAPNYTLAAWQRILTKRTNSTQYILTLCILSETQAIAAIRNHELVTHTA